MYSQLMIIRFVGMLLILIAQSFITNAQNIDNVPKLVSGKFIINELKARCVPRDGRCCAIGIYKFKVEQNGSVDSVICLGNTGRYLDSLQINEFRSLKFKPFILKKNTNMLQWFQVKIYSTSVINETSKYLRGLEDTIYVLYKQEIKDYFPNEKSFLIKDNIIYLPPTWVYRVQ